MFKTASAACVFAALFAGSALAADPSWLDKDLLAKAKANNEKKIVVYASMNEREGHPLFKVFTEATGIEVDYVRASDVKLMARIGVEKRAGKEAWDLMQTTSLKKMPQEWLADIGAIPLAKNIPAEARDAKGKWIAVYANYNSPAYNTKLVKKEDLPKTYEDFLKKKDWAGKVAIDFSDEEWLAAMYKHYGKEKGEKLVKEIVAVLKPKLTRGHLAMARSVGAGEWAVALNNYTNLTVNVKMRGGATDFWVMEPVAVFYGQVGVNAKASAPHAARLAANFLISKEGQTAMTKGGRIPVLPGVPSNPPDVLEAFKGKKVYPILFDPKESAAWTKVYKRVMSAR